MPLLLVGVLVAAVALSAITGLDGLAPKRAKGPGGANVAGFARGGGGAGGPRSVAARAASAIQNFGFGVDGPSLPTPPAAIGGPAPFSSSVPAYAPVSDVAPPVFVPYTGVDPVTGAPLGGSVMAGTDPGKGGLYQPPLVKAPDGQWVYPDQLPYHQLGAPASTPQSPSGYTPPPSGVSMAPPPVGAAAQPAAPATAPSSANAGPVPTTYVPGSTVPSDPFSQAYPIYNSAPIEGSPEATAYDSNNQPLAPVDSTGAMISQ